MEKLMFLQAEYAGYPAGTPVVEAEKSSAHHQASVMVDSQIPTGYYKLAGTEGPATMAIPRFEGLVGDKHPTDPKVVGPFVCTGLGVISEDKLPRRYVGYITPCYKNPFVEVNICMNTELEGSVFRVVVPERTTINYFSTVEKYFEKVREGGVEFEVEYVEYSGYPGHTVNVRVGKTLPKSYCPIEGIVH